MQVFEESGLVDGHERTQPHRNGRELPELRHQPRVRIRGQSIALDFLAEAEKLLLAQSALDEGPRINARRRVTLDIDEIAAMFRRGRAPKMREASIVKSRRRLEARYVAAELRRLFIRPKDDCECIPTNDRADAVLDRAVAGMPFLVLGRNRVQIGCGGAVGNRSSSSARSLEHTLEQVVRSPRPVHL